MPSQNGVPIEGCQLLKIWHVGGQLNACRQVFSVWKAWFVTDGKALRGAGFYKEEEEWGCQMERGERREKREKSSIE